MKSNRDDTHTESQLRAIEKDLKRGRKITPMDALLKYSCFRLSGRIFELRARGMNIKTNLIEKGKRWVAEYKLVK